MNRGASQANTPIITPYSLFFHLQANSVDLIFFKISSPSFLLQNMTVVNLKPSQVDALALDFPLSSSSSPVRFNLKKRTVQSANSSPKLCSYNSAFLSGLFADVAKVQDSPSVPQARQDEEGCSATTTTSTEVSSTVRDEEVRSDPRLDSTIPVKKSRISLTKSMSRCGRSYGNLAHVISPVAVELFEDATMPAPASTSEIGQSISMKKMDSLHFQLGCVGVGSPKSIKSVVDIVDMAFPHLPPTVSDPSCTKEDLTQKPVRAVSDCENSNISANNDGDNKRESYGWFVDMDDDDEEHDHSDANPYATADASNDLAFSAPTAPKRKSNYQAEVEWAKAADTVDDVLGDFF